jgi:hypothetical protein
LILHRYLQTGRSKALSKRTRFILALIAGLLALVLAHQISFATAKANADATPQICDTASRTAYEDLRIDRNVERSPAYLLSIAEDFLANCNTPIHVQAVAKHAARAALDAGQTDRSLGHFERALSNGASLTEAEQLDHILALWLNDQSEQAWTLRDDLIEDWLNKAAIVADITSINVRDGIIHKLTFDTPVGKVRTRTHWLAQPHGEGWPAAISYDADPALIALLSFRMGPNAEAMKNLTLIQCRGRKVAARKFGEFEDAVADETAIETLKTYLRQPQSPHTAQTGQPAAACYASDRLFLPVR